MKFTLHRRPRRVSRHVRQSSVANSIMRTTAPREGDPLLRRTVKSRGHGLVATTVALGVAACGVVVLAGVGNVHVTTTTPDGVVGMARSTPTPTPTLRSRLGAATNAATRAKLIEEAKAKMEKKAREIDDAAARALRKAQFENDDLEAAERDVGDETCPSKEAKTQTAYEKRIQKMFEKEKVAVEARKKIDDKPKASKGKPK